MREIFNIFCKKFKALKTFFLFLLITFFCFIKPSYSKDFNYYDDLVKDWIKIFPDQNRNAAGPKFFKHILDKEITYQDFIEYNKLYCAVFSWIINISKQSTRFCLFKKCRKWRKNLWILS